MTATLTLPTEPTKPEVDPFRKPVLLYGEALLPLYRESRLCGWTKVSEEDYDELVRYLWRRLAGGYVVRYEGRVATLMHRQIMGLAVGDGMEVDHFDRDPSNNTRSNLRLANRLQQCLNTRTRSPYGRGVSRTENGRYWAQGKIHGKTHYLGRYDTAEEAAAVAAAWREEHHAGHH